ncbi:hypothetical protein KJ359_010391 [Pestalotiopsis sp. 9143b]|nr:hypothetical protein KJ359_010391 [Pestalotiopsis sp. 9143b]
MPAPTPQPVETLPAVEALQSAVKLFASFSTSDSFKYLQDILKENSSSKAKIKELEIAKKVNLETLVDLKSELRDASDRASKSQAAHEKAEKETKLLKATIEDLKKKVSDQKKELQSTSDEMTHLQMVLKRREVEVRESKDGAKEADERAKSALKQETDANTALAKMREEFNKQLNELRQFESFKLQLPDASLQAV